jgi:hypothetical protein
MTHVRCNLYEGLQHEAAFVHSGMWDRQAFRFEYQVPEQHYVDVDSSWAFVDQALAAELVFDLSRAPQ